MSIGGAGAVASKRALNFAAKSTRMAGSLVKDVVLLAGIVLLSRALKPKSKPTTTKPK